MTLPSKWGREKDNLADYFTKNHPTKHHRSIRGTYLVPPTDSSKHACYQVPRNLRGCVKSPPIPGKGRRTDKVSYSYERTKDGKIQIEHTVETAITKYIKPLQKPSYFNAGVCLRTIPSRFLAMRRVLITSTTMQQQEIIVYRLCRHPNS